MKYIIFEGKDQYKNIPLYHVNGVDNEYVGEWHTDIRDAQDELFDLVSKEYNHLDETQGHINVLESILESKQDILIDAVFDKIKETHLFLLKMRKFLLINHQDLRDSSMNDWNQQFNSKGEHIPFEQQ